MMAGEPLSPPSPSWWAGPPSSPLRCTWVPEDMTQPTTPERGSATPMMGQGQTFWDRGHSGNSCQRPIEQPALDTAFVLSKCSAVLKYLATKMVREHCLSK